MTKRSRTVDDALANDSVVEDYLLALWAANPRKEKTDTATREAIVAQTRDAPLKLLRHCFFFEMTAQSQCHVGLAIDPCTVNAHRLARNLHLLDYVHWGGLGEHMTHLSWKECLDVVKTRRCAPLRQIVYAVPQDLIEDEVIHEVRRAPWTVEDSVALPRMVQFFLELHRWQPLRRVRAFDPESGRLFEIDECGKIVRGLHVGAVVNKAGTADATTVTLTCSDGNLNNVRIRQLLRCVDGKNIRLLTKQFFDFPKKLGLTMREMHAALHFDLEYGKQSCARDALSRVSAMLGGVDDIESYLRRTRQHRILAPEQDVVCEFEWRTVMLHADQPHATLDKYYEAGFEFASTTEQQVFVKRLRLA